MDKNEQNPRQETPDEEWARLLRIPNPAPCTPQEKMPPTNLVWSILALLCCCMPAAIVALIYSSQVSNKYHSGDLEGAKKASDRAALWVIISVVTGVVWMTLYTPIAILTQIQ